MNESEHDWHLVVLSLIVLCMTLELVILLVLSFKFCCQKTERGQHREKRFEFNQGWTVIFILFCMATAASDFVHIYMGDVGDDNSIYSNRFRFVVSVADFFYFVYTIQLYVFLIYRVYAIFRGTPYQVSNLTMLIFALLFVVNVCLMLYYLVIAIQVEHHIIDNDTFNPLLWIPMIAMDILINTVIMYVMVSKLRNIVIATSLPDASQSVNDLRAHAKAPLLVAQGGAVVDDHGQIYIDIMSKFCVLSATIVIFNQIFGAWLLSTVLIGAFGHKSTTYVNIVQNVGYGMRDVEGLIDCFVVYLTFKMNESMYNACCGCHACLYKCFLTNINREIQNKH